MKDLKDMLTAEELEQAMKIVGDVADKFLDEITKEKSDVSEKLKLLEGENESLRKEYSEISDWTKRSELSDKRREVINEIELLKNNLTNIDNILKAISNGGRIINLEDKTGKKYDKVADFRKVSTESIVFDIDTILVEETPNYIPFINEKDFERRGTVLDTIRIAEDTYVVCYGSFDYNEGNDIFLLTLDQLMLTNLYYLTKLKATYKKEADRRTERSKDYYFNLPIERRERHVNQRGFYSSLPAKIKKNVSESKWESLSLDEKEKIYAPYKKYGSKRVKSTLEDDKMYSSFHFMYNAFVNPEALPYTIDKRTRQQSNVKIGQRAVGLYGHKEVFSYWNMFKEMMEYKLKDISFQRSELSETYKTAVETSFGESNTNDALLSEYGVLVKRQNGDKINPNEIRQIQDSLNNVQHIFGGLKELFLKNNIKISHAGKRLIFAMKAVGVYIPSMGTIGVSDKNGELNFNSTTSHEIAHFLDNEVGKENGKRWATDNYESTAGIIAFTFRNSMNKPKSQQTDYINATKECFARALQQYFVVKHYGDDTKIIYGYGQGSVEDNIYNQENYVNKTTFKEKIEPLIVKFFEENKDIFNKIEKTIAVKKLINYKEILDKKFNISGKYPKQGIDFIKGVKEIFVDEEYKGKRVSKQVSKDAEKLYGFLLNGDLKGINEIRNRYFREWNKSHSKKGTQRDRFVSVDTSKIELYNVSNASYIFLTIGENIKEHIEPKNELDEAIETLELLKEISDNKEEINEAIEILKILK